MRHLSRSFQGLRTSVHDGSPVGIWISVIDIAAPE
jgi:hypothetical protein